MAGATSGSRAIWRHGVADEDLPRGFLEFAVGPLHLPEGLQVAGLRDAEQISVFDSLGERTSC
jgi:hypothetical protein